MYTLYLLENYTPIWQNEGKKMDTYAIHREVFEVFKVIAIAGFVTTATLIINLNFKTYSKVASHHSKYLMWVFLLVAIIPLLLILFFFSLFFGNHT